MTGDFRRWSGVIIVVMRPSLLNPLFAPAPVLPSMAGKTEGLYAKLTVSDAGLRVLDLLFHLPTGAVDRRHQPKQGTRELLFVFATAPHAASRPPIKFREIRRSTELDGVLRTALITHYGTSSNQPNNRVLDRQTKAT